MTIEFVQNVDWAIIAQHVSKLFAGSFGLWASTQLVKKSKYIPISEGQTARIRWFVALLALVGTALERFASGQLDPTNIQNIGSVLIDALAAFVIAHTAHKLAKPAVVVETTDEPAYVQGSAK